MKEGELRVFLHLAAIACANHQKGMPYAALASSRAIAKALGMARPAVQHAIDSLSRRNLIGTRQGTATKASAYILHGLDTVRIGGSLGMPPPTPQVAFFESQGGSLGMPPPASIGNGGGSRKEPPQPLADPDSIGNHPRASDRSLEDSKTDLIDRLLKASPKDFEPDQIAEARRHVHGYQAKFARDKNPHPPDDLILAQLLAVAPWPRLLGMLYDLMGERKEPGERYAWYITVALQRIHGIKPGELNERREALKLVARARPAPDPNDSRQYAQDLLAEVVQSKRGGLR